MNKESKKKICPKCKNTMTEQLSQVNGTDIFVEKYYCFSCGHTINKDILNSSSKKLID